MEPTRGGGSDGAPRWTTEPIDPSTRSERTASPRGGVSCPSRAREAHGHPERRELSRPGGRRYVHRRRRLRLRVRADARGRAKVATMRNGG